MFRFSSLACKSLVKFTTSTSVAFDQAGLLGADWHTLDLIGKAPIFNIIQIGECLEKLSPPCSNHMIALVVPVREIPGNGPMLKQTCCRREHA